MTIFSRLRAAWPGLLALVLAVTLAACDATNTAPDDEPPQEDAAAAALDPDALAATLAGDLNFTDAQTASVRGLFVRHLDPQEREPGALWYVAAELQALLTDAQIDRLTTPPDSARDGRFRPFRDGDMRGSRRLRPLGRVFRFIERELELTDEQRAALRAVAEASRADLRDLVAARRDSSLSPEAFREALDALRAETKAAIEDVLTDEQVAELKATREARAAAREARREARAAARADALNLTDAQQATLEALHAETKAAFDALRADVQAGTLSREDARAAARALRAETRAVVEATLSAEQVEIVQIHRALVRHIARAHRHDGPRGPRRRGSGRG